MPSNIEVRIYDDRLTIWNPGGLPLGITMDDLFKPHGSVLRNKGIGAVLYDMGLIEQWGSGIGKMLKFCSLAGIPVPHFEEYQSGFLVEFRKNIYTEEYLRKLGLNERQINAVAFLKEKGKISNKDYRKLSGLSDEGARKDLNELIEKNIVESKGKGRSIHYILK
jgi:ATP-dependent DNA helicase RecG